MTRSRFTKADLAKAISAARAAGLEPEEVVIEPSGAIRIVALDASTKNARCLREEIEKHFAQKR